ncbi:MAG: hypothetical protein ACI9VR_003505 [Cognaticolwellia sp.]|jgi:hypothetical protein
MPVSRLLFRSLVALVSIGAVGHTATRSAPAQAAEDDGASSNEASVFARYSELDDEATESALKELSGDETTHEALSSINKLLASGATAKEIEKTVLTLVEKAKSQDTDTILAAVMLDYYESYLQEDLQSGEIQPADVFKEMGAANDVLTEATYGAKWKTSKSIRKRLIRR